MKKCAKCNEEKQLNSFYRKRSSKDGRGSFCKECTLNNNKKIRLSGLWKSEYNKNWREKNRIKDRTHKKLYKFIKKNEIKRPLSCDMCQKQCEVVAHHEDYDRPYDVLFVCRKCHSDIHNGNLTIEKGMIRRLNG